MQTKKTKVTNNGQRDSFVGLNICHPNYVRSYGKASLDILKKEAFSLAFKSKSPNNLRGKRMQEIT